MSSYASVMAHNKYPVYRTSTMVQVCLYTVCIWLKLEYRGIKYPAQLHVAVKIPDQLKQLVLLLKYFIFLVLLEDFNFICLSISRNVCTVSKNVFVPDLLIAHALFSLSMSSSLHYMSFLQ